MPKPSPEYRTDHLACPVNAGKLSRVRDLVLVMRQVAGREAKLQWQMFYQGGWQGFEHSAGKGWSRSWVGEGVLNTTFSQMVMNQVAASLKGHLGNVQNTYTELVSNSFLPPQIRHQLHFINRKKAWFWQCDVKLRQMSNVGMVCSGSEDAGGFTKCEQEVIVSPEVRTLAKALIRKALALHRKPHFKRFQPQLDQRACFIQQAHTAKHPYWLAMSTLTGKERIHLPLEMHEAFLTRNKESAFAQALARGIPEGPPPQFHPLPGEPSFLGHMQAMEQQVGKERNPYPATNLSLPNTVRLLLSEDHGSLRIGVVSDMRQAFEHQAATYVPLQETLCLDLGLCTLLATDDGELHGRDWMETLQKFDRIITGIARHRQRLGLRVASERYRFHVQRLRGWLKTELNRIVNRLVARKRPGAIILEALDFQHPRMSRRLNRLIQNFGKGVLTQKMADLERQFGITVEYREAAYTSKECHSCGYVDEKNRKSQAKFQCRFCGKTIHADIQASRVLRDRRSVVVPFQGTRLARQHTLVERVSSFNKRHTRPRGGPADPRFTNPHFSQWSALHWKEQVEGCRGEVIQGLGSPGKKAA